jgi:formamidopyrimidine-DNA glycosylase
MPELPEVQTIADDLRKMISGRAVEDIVTLTRSIWRYKIPKKATLIYINKSFQRRHVDYPPGNDRQAE